MSDPVADVNNFNVFFAEKMRPEVELVTRRRRAARSRSLLLGLGVFLIFFLVVYFALNPYFKLLGDHDILYWPLLVLLPATMAVIGFSFCYILSFRSMVARFRQAVVSRLAEFVDPGMVHEENRPIPREELQRSLLFGGLGEPSSGQEHFRGRRDNAVYELAEVKAVGKEGDWTGVFYSARFDRRFPALLVVLTSTVPASLSMMESYLKAMEVPHADELVRLEVPGYPLQLITRPRDQEAARRLLPAVFTPDLLVYCHSRNVDPFLSCIHDKLSMALVRRVEGKEEAGAVFDVLDIGRCRDFCRDARMCLSATDILSRNMALWEAKVN